jgi:hypothetical protein
MTMIGIHLTDIVNKVVGVQKRIIETRYSSVVIDFFKRINCSAQISPRHTESAKKRGI